MNISKELLLDIRVRLGLFYFYAKCGTDWFYDRNVRRETFAQIKIVQLQKQLFELQFSRLSSSCSIDAGSNLIFTCYPDFGFSITIFDTCLESIWIVLLKILLRIQFRFKITNCKNLKYPINLTAKKPKTIQPRKGHGFRMLAEQN